MKTILYSSEFLLCEKRDILSKIPCLHTWLKDAGLIYKILRVSMKNYIDVAMSTKSDAMKKIAERWERDGM